MDWTTQVPRSVVVDGGLKLDTSGIHIRVGSGDVGVPEAGARGLLSAAGGQDGRWRVEHRVPAAEAPFLGPTSGRGATSYRRLVRRGCLRGKRMREVCIFFAQRRRPSGSIVRAWSLIWHQPRQKRRRTRQWLGIGDGWAEP